MRSITKGDKPIKLVLKGGQRVQPVPPGNSLIIESKMIINDKGNNKKEKEFPRGNPTSRDPKKIGIKQLPNPP